MFIPIDPVTATATVTGFVTIATLLITSIFAFVRDRNKQRREDAKEARDEARYHDRVAATDAIEHKIDVNTKVNDEQIRVSNNVNVKLVETTQTAAAANTAATAAANVAVAANAVAVDAVSQLKRDIADLRSEVRIFAEATTRNSTQITLLLARNLKAD